MDLNRLWRERVPWDSHVQLFDTASNQFDRDVESLEQIMLQVEVWEVDDARVDAHLEIVCINFLHVVADVAGEDVFKQFLKH